MSSQQRTILLVDDDHENVAFLVRTFRNDFELLTATSGERALQLLQDKRVDVIITDQRMPGMVGTQLLERSIEIQPDCVRIILSAFNDTSDFLDAINVCRVNHFLMKPAPPEKLRDVVSTALSLSKKATRYARMSTAFDLRAMASYYEHHGLLGTKAFEKAFEDTIKIRGLNLADLDWLLYDHLLSVHRDRIPLLNHYEALAVGLHVPFDGITSFLDVMIQLKLFPPSVLNRTVFYRAPKRGLELGELMVALGLATTKELERGLEVQEIIQKEVGCKPVIGQILRSVARLSTVDLFQALAIQNGVPFVTLDESAPEIFATAIKRGSPT